MSRRGRKAQLCVVSSEVDAVDSVGKGVTWVAGVNWPTKQNHHGEQRSFAYPHVLGWLQTQEDHFVLPCGWFMLMWLFLTPMKFSDLSKPSFAAAQEEMT